MPFFIEPRTGHEAAEKINDNRVAKFTQFNEFESGFNFSFFSSPSFNDFWLLFSFFNDVLMENGQINFQVYNIFHYRSLEPSAAVKDIRHPFVFINFRRTLRPVYVVAYS